MTDEAIKVFSRAFKLAALNRMMSGENVSALARELGVRRKYLYQWRERFRAGGPQALRSRGRPSRAEALAISAHGAGVTPEAAGAMVSPVPPGELVLAQRRIAELERKIGQQQLDLDFFRAALRQVGEARRPSGGPGGTASMRSSRR